METARVLVVDDEMGICQNVKKILSRKNYEVTKAFSAREALEKMAEGSFSLLISDIIMPEMNGLELLRLVKDQWPLTRVIMMTAYASTDTAVKAIRLGALDYIPKPFTPEELRSTVKKALSGDLLEVAATENEKAAIDVIDLDVPFDREEVAVVAGDAYAGMIGPSDMPVVEVPKPESLPYYCAVGQKVCDIYKKLGATCKAGVKTGECPQLKKAKKKKAAGGPALDTQSLIGIDQPFDYEEVASVTGSEYVANMDRNGVPFYEDLKARLSRDLKKEAEPPRAGIGPVEDRAEATILVIDDEIAVNNNIRKILSKKGLSADQAMTREEALAGIEKRAYDLVLLDLKMPGVKDLDLLKAIVERRPETRVIIITGYASIETAVETARMGAVGYLPKPFTPDEIRTATENALRLAA